MTVETGEKFDDLLSFYRVDEEIDVTALPEGTSRVIARVASGRVVHAAFDRSAHFGRLESGTYCVQALDANGGILAEEFTTIGGHQGERPVHGFATSFEPEDVTKVLEWHRSLRSTVVQIYDWMASYTEPLGALSGWKDPSNRAVSFDALRELATGLQRLGAVAHAYAPIYAVGNAFAEEHPEMLLYQDDGVAIRFLDQIVLANPGNESWQQHFAESYGSAMDAIGFNGLHVDTYGYPRVSHDADGNAVDIRAAYESFLKHLRAARSSDLISFNQVNGVPSAAHLSHGPGFRYCEVWPPNDGWRHLESLMDRSSGRAGLTDPVTRDPLLRGSIACYPPVWGIDGPTGPISEEARESALRTVVYTEAIVTCLGGSSLLYGDVRGALCDPYYPKHVRLDDIEAKTVLDWHRFSLRCRDLFYEGEDTSWYEIGDENGSVVISADAPVKPEPIGGSAFARVVHGEDVISVSVIDLTGSENATWSEVTLAGTLSKVTVRVLLDDPESWRADAAVLGADAGRFAPIVSSVASHRQGRAIEVDLPLIEGWSVLRLRRETPGDE
ncbi:MAG TPA: glycoside hydrolase family 66 protein [Acidimicrobiales bacterium]|nr:glycoside hydrolase family 66 protein [Acidimicrobiales bacterium]